METPELKLLTAAGIGGIEKALAVAIEPSRIAELRQKPALSERALLDQVLHFANHGDQASSLVLAQGVDSPKVPDPALETAADALLGPDAMAMARTAQRDALVVALSTILAKKATSALIDNWRRRASGLLFLPSFNLDGRNLRVTFQYIGFEFYIDPPSAEIAFALMLLLDSERPFGRDLCKCRLETCGKFFWAKRRPTGRPQRLYCTNAHLHIAHMANASERVRRSRIKRKRALTVKGRRRTKWQS